MGEFSVPMRRTHSGSTISVPRAVEMTPRSMTSVCPNDSSRSMTVFLASVSLPDTNTEWSPSASCAGLTISAAVRVLSALTTRSRGKAAWICSPRLSVSLTNSVGGRRRPGRPCRCPELRSSSWAPYEVSGSGSVPESRPATGQVSRRVCLWPRVVTAWVSDRMRPSWVYRLVCSIVCAGLQQEETMSQPAQPARERILDTAFRLFYAHGPRGVGVDTVIAESGVAKATLYKHFPRKDDLILAYLDKVDQTWFGQLRAAARAAGDDPREQMVGMFDALAAACRREGYHGCAFINTAAESDTGS